LTKKIIISGIPGVGKSTVCKEAKKLAEKMGEKVEILNYGTIMLEIAKKKGKILHRDDIRKLPLEIQQELQKEAAKYIFEKASKSEGSVIIDTHMIIRTENGYFIGLPKHVLEIIKPHVFVLIEAEPDEILSRRFRDAERKRDKILKKEIIEEIELSKFVASVCAVSTGALIKIVKNPKDKQHEAAKEIVKLLG